MTKRDAYGTTEALVVEEMRAYNPAYATRCPCGDCERTPATLKLKYEGESTWHFVCGVCSLRRLLDDGATTPVLF